MEARAYIVTSNGVNGEGFATVGRFVGKNFYARWGERSFVEIKMAMDLSMSGKFWIDAGWPKNVEGEDSLRKELVPEV
jgi:hypothetical protein